MSKVNLSNLKVSMPEGYKRVFTLEDIDACKTLLSSVLSGFDAGKLDLSSEVVTALSLASGAWACSDDVYDVRVEYAKNGRIAYDYHGDGCGIMDLWVTVHGLVDFAGFYIVGFYLSDIWCLSADNRDVIKSRMYIREFKEAQV